MSILNNSPINNKRLESLGKSVMKPSEKAPSPYPVPIKPKASAESDPENGKSLFGKSLAPKNMATNGSPEDASVFHGKEELARSEFRKALRENYVGSGMSASERVSIEKRDLPAIYGPSISKTDLKTSVHKLNQKMQSLQNPADKAQIRKDIKYLKKIGKF